MAVPMSWIGTDVDCTGREGGPLVAGAHERFLSVRHSVW